MPTYTLNQVAATINKAADDIIDVFQLPEQGARDVLNLLVNVTLKRLMQPDLSIQEVISDEYPSSYHGIVADLSADMTSD